MKTTDDANQGRKLYHHLAERMELTPEQKQVLWNELQSWFGTDSENHPITEESAKEQVRHLIQRMG